ncbi:MAG: hypothetical protein WC675_02960 [Patescibacteria group bacterium]|jgi:hypothetical protein
MSSRTIIIFSIFIAVAMVASVFTYLYHSQTDWLLKQYVDKLGICGNLSDEKTCFAKDECEGIYGPTCPQCQDLEFKRCQKIPLNVLVATEQEKKLCQDTGGFWYRNKLGNFCLCQETGAGKTFDKIQGCINK